MRLWETLAIIAVIWMSLALALALMLGQIIRNRNRNG